MKTPAEQLAEVLEPLTHMQRLYVQARLDGKSKTASALAAGSKNPQNFEDSDNVQNALRAARTIAADAVLFSRKEAHDMLLAAYHNAATAMEQVAAVKELVRMHGIAAPEVKELRHKHSGLIEHKHEAIEHMTDKELLELANLDQAPFIEAEYEVVQEEGEQECLPAPVKNTE